MNPFLKIAIWGLGISALGTLPLSVLNIAAMQISIAEGVRNASLFSLGVALVEVIYVRVSVVGIHWISKHGSLLRWLDWAAFGIVAILAVTSFMAAGQPDGGSKNLILNSNIHPFVLGMTMSAVNPMQIPFWFGWSTVLFAKGVLLPGKHQYNWYILGIGLGTLTGLAVFVAGGQVLVTHLNKHQQAVNYSIAGIFAITALVFLYKVLFNKGAASAIGRQDLSMASEMLEKKP